MPIKYLENKKTWILETKNSAYVFAIYKDNHIKNLYWGEKLINDYDYPDLSSYSLRDYWQWDDEYTVRGEANYVEHCLKIEYDDGVRDVVLTYKDYIIKDKTIIIVLNDIEYNLEVLLKYNLIEEYDIIEREVEIINKSYKEIKIESFATGSVYLPSKKAKLTYLTGMWAHETRPQKHIIKEGKKILESRIGYTGPFINPYFSIDYDATEDYGEVYYGEIAWSGNWKITFQKQLYERIAVVMGINDWDFQYILNSNEKFSSPKIILGYSSEGFSKASQSLHHYQIDYVLPKKNSKELRKILYNSWEATMFNVNEENQKKLAKKASEIGVELFVVDDGWFGNRNSDKSGLGDWFVNPEKFPNSLKPLIDYVNSLGMDFGLWVEPEMVNPDSLLYKKNPDWVINFPNRPRTKKRNQLILNLAREEVKKYIISFMKDLLKNNNIKFIKWDLNRYIYESGWPEIDKKYQKEIWVKYVYNFYEIWETLRNEFPDVIFESCAGGGGRIDLGIMKYSDQFWTSDNTDPFDREIIQEGFSYGYCSKTMMSWVTDWGGKTSYPIEFRFHTSMMGSLGIGVDLNNYSEDELKLFKQNIDLYKEIRHIVQNGYQYRLIKPSEETHCSVQYLSKDLTEGIIFFLENPEKLNLFDYIDIKLKGLNNQSNYYVEDYYEKISGKALMKVGLRIDLSKEMIFGVKEKAHFRSKIIRFKKI